MMMMMMMMMMTMTTTVQVIASMEVPGYPACIAHCIFARSEHVGLLTLRVYRMLEAGSQHVGSGTRHVVFGFSARQQRSIARLFSTD